MNSWNSSSLIYILNLRIPEIHLFYNLQDFYWHFLEILWLFIFLFLYSFSREMMDINTKLAREKDMEENDEDNRQPRA